MATTKIKGQNFRVFVGGMAAGNAVPEATNCNVTLQGNMEDGSTKDTENTWQQETMMTKTWNVSVDNIDASVASLRALISRFNSDSKVTVGWDQTTTTAGGQNRTPASAAFARSGQAILNDISIQATNRQNVQVTCQYLGSGELS